MNKGGNRLAGFTRLEAHESLYTKLPKRLRMSGFTIVETLIVLAVTGVLFASAVVLINGRQSKTEFQTGINSTQQELQQIINETASSYFPNKGSFTCVGSATGSPTLRSGTADQGTNTDCIFVGKVMQLAPNANGCSGVNGGTSGYIVYPLAGNQREGGGSGDETQSLYASGSLNGARPVAVASCGSGPDITTAGSFEGGLSVVGAKTTYTDAGGSTRPIGAFGFLTSFGSYDSQGQLSSSSQQLGLYAVSPSAVGDTKSSAINEIQASNSLKPARAVNICLASGGTPQSGLFTISAQLTISVVIMNGKTC